MKAVAFLVVFYLIIKLFSIKDFLKLINFKKSFLSRPDWDEIITIFHPISLSIRDEQLL